MLYFSVFIAFCGSFLFGYTTCIIAGALLFLSQQFNLSDFQQGILVSITLFGAMIGSLIGGMLHDRRYGLMLTGVVFIAGILLSTVSHFYLLLLGRTITGIGVGIASMIVPVYLTEISPAKYRGRIGSMNMLGIAIGIFFAYLVNYLFSESGDWQWMFAIGLIPALVLFLGTFYILDSSYTKDPGFTHERVILKLWSPKYRYLVLLGALLSLSQQTTGINVVNYYAPQIFQTAGFHSAEMATYATLAIGFITVLASLVTTWLIDHWGRRPLLLVSLAGMACSLGSLAIAYHLDNGFLGTVALVTLPLYTAFFTIGMGSALWVYLSEMFPSTIRSQAMSLAAFINWLGNYLISLVFPALAKVWGVGGVFTMFAFTCAFTFVFIRYLPETKGKELSET